MRASTRSTNIGFVRLGKVATGKIHPSWPLSRTLSHVCAPRRTCGKESMGSAPASTHSASSSGSGGPPGTAPLSRAPPSAGFAAAASAAAAAGRYAIRALCCRFEQYLLQRPDREAY